MKIVLSSCVKLGIDVRSDRELSDLECAGDFMLLSEESRKLQGFLSLR